MVVSSIDYIFALRVKLSLPQFTSFRYTIVINLTLFFSHINTDKDNTLTYTYHKALHPSVKKSVHKSREIFGERNIAILSNSVGSCDDTDFHGAVDTETSLGIPVIRHMMKKPACLQEVLDHFKQKFGRDISPEEICMIG